MFTSFLPHSAHWGAGGVAHEFTLPRLFSGSMLLCLVLSPTLWIPEVPSYGVTFCDGENVVLYLVRGILKQPFLWYKVLQTSQRKNSTPPTYTLHPFRVGIGGHWAGMETGDMSEPSPLTSTHLPRLRLCVFPAPQPLALGFRESFPTTWPHVPK